MTVGRNPLQGSFIQPRTAMANFYGCLASVVLIFASVSVTQVSSEKVAQATADPSALVLIADPIEVQSVNASVACVPDRTSTYAGSTFVEFTTVTAGCTWTVPPGVTSLTEVLIVAGGGGGGGGGKWAGGGGAGEVISLTSVSVGSTVDIAVGGGGAAEPVLSGSCLVSATGGNSFLVSASDSTTAFGGGGGGPDNDGSCRNNLASSTYIGGGAGGSGGGGGQAKYPVAASTAGTMAHSNGYGNVGGTFSQTLRGNGNRRGTGGGGAGAAGGSLTVTSNTGGPGGNGGDGTNLFHSLINAARLAAPESTLGQLVNGTYYVSGGGSGSSSTGNSGTGALGGFGGGGRGTNTGNKGIPVASCSAGVAQTGGGGG